VGNNETLKNHEFPQQREGETKKLRAMNLEEGKNGDCVICVLCTKEKRAKAKRTTTTSTTKLTAMLAHMKLIRSCVASRT
jgi:hypothetical protein